MIPQILCYIFMILLVDAQVYAIPHPHASSIKFTTCEQQYQIATACNTALIHYLDMTLDSLLKNQTQEAATFYNNFISIPSQMKTATRTGRTSCRTANAPTPRSALSAPTMKSWWRGYNRCIAKSGMEHVCGILCVHSLKQWSLQHEERAIKTFLKI